MHLTDGVPADTPDPKQSATALSRRRLLLAVAAGAGAVVVGAGEAKAAAGVPRHGSRPRRVGGLDPAALPKYVTPLPVLPAMPPVATDGGVDQYRLAARQFSQQILPDGLPATLVWGYGSSAHPDSFHFPALPLEATVGRPVRALWANELLDAQGRFLPHLLPVDPTLHWANPAGGEDGRDSRPTFTATPGPYRGPVPMVPHLHGARVPQEADGYPEAWYLPDAVDIPDGYARTGSFHAGFARAAADAGGADWPAGAAVFEYPNDQRATALWLHDHTLGMTRLNIYAGLCGTYLLRGGEADLPAGALPGPAPAPGDAPGTAYREIPIVIQDRSFEGDGSLFFPAGRGFVGDVPEEGPFVPESDVPPIWNPESFGDTMVVNGRTWPVLEVEARRYRFRLVNGSNARTLLLKIAADPLAERPAAAALPCWQIGSDGGFLPAPARLDQVLLGVGERADVVVDFGGLPAGAELHLINEGPDEAYGGGLPGSDFEAADPATTGQVLKFVVTAASSADTSLPPERLALPARTPLGTPERTRELSLSETLSTSFRGAPVMAMLGTVTRDSRGRIRPVPLGWGDEVTEDPDQHAVELWELYNFTGHAHPIHVHQVMLEIVERETFRGTVRAPEPWETGHKDTVIAHPREITRIRLRFDLAGRFAWHCHITDHEDNEMMRPLDVHPR
ncbi:multicopper oxidase domain-containing protein [Kitasatospora sp. NPDC094015]|uniref:multicopper oxidase family protein n=1 Tax=Kitasatospora sp. NPDC094015 TaxID=3155205 RepID=UPI00332F705A